MELRTFFEIFVVHKMIFWSTVFCSIAVGVVLFFIQPDAYKTMLTLNITRSGVQSLNEYTYDDFYRLQADERFADTVVQWIKSPHITRAVFESENNVNVTPKRLSSQVIAVEYKTQSVKEGQIIAKKMISALNTESEKLNHIQNQRSWFIILGSDPIIQSAQYSFHFLLGLFSVIGFFMAFWTVMIINYVIDTGVKKK